MPVTSRSSPPCGAARISFSVLEEAQVACPYCGQPLTILLDLSEPEQEYIEDCQVCCQPMNVRYSSVEGQLLSVSAERTDS